MPDETTICKFRHLLEAHQLTARMFDAVKALLEERKLLLKAGTIVDATIIGAPSSTKNATQTRDPEMRQTKKGNQCYFGLLTPSLLKRQFLHTSRNAAWATETTYIRTRRGSRHLAVVIAAGPTIHCELVFNALVSDAK